MSAVDTLMRATALSSPVAQRRKLHIIGDGLNVIDNGVKNDGRRGWFYATWANQTNAVSMYSLQATVTVSGTVVSWAGTDVGRNFQPSDVGTDLAVAGVTWGGAPTVKIARWISAFKVTVAVAADQTLTAQANTKMIWPAMLAADAGMAIWIDRAGVEGTVLAYRGSNIAPKITTIATVTDAFNFTTSTLLGAANTTGGGVVPGVADATPSKIAWGTDNTATIFASAALAVRSGFTSLYFPPGYYLALGVVGIFGNTVDVPGSVEALAQLQWFGDSASGLFTSASGAPIYKRIIPRDAGAAPPPMRGVFGPKHFPRLKAALLATGSAVAVSWGDSMGTAEPDLPQQGFAQSPERARIGALLDQNGGKNISFFDRAIGGGTFWWANSIPLSFPDWYTNHANSWESYVRTLDAGGGGVPSVVTPDLVMLTHSGSNDSTAISPRLIAAVLSKIAAWPKSGGLAPDVMLNTARPTGPVRAQADLKIPDYVEFMYPQEYIAMLIWSMAQKRGYGCLNYHDALMLAMYGNSSFHTTLTRIPDHAGRSVTTVRPLQIAGLCHDFKVSLVLNGANGAAVWGNGQKIVIRLSPRSDNVLVVSTDAAGYLTIEAWVWRIDTTATVTCDEGSNALTTAGGTTTTPATSSGTRRGTFGADAPLTAVIGTYSSSSIGRAVLQGGAGYAQADGGFHRTSATDLVGSDTVRVPDQAIDGSLKTSQTLTVGGMPFVQSDADAQVDIVVGSNAPNKIVGYTSTTAVTLRDNATVAYSGAANTPITIGDACVPKTSTALQAANDPNANPILSISLVGNVLQVGYHRNTVDQNDFPVWRGTIVKHGSVFYPTVSVTGAALTITPIQIYIDKPMMFRPTITPLEAWGTPEQGLGYDEGGNGLVHNSFTQLTAVDVPLLNAQVLTAA